MSLNDVTVRQDQQAGNRLGQARAAAMGRVRAVWRYPDRGFKLFLLFEAFVLARYVQVGARRDFLAAMRFEFLLGMLVVGLAVGQLGRRQPKVGRAGSILGLIALLFVAMLVQVPFAAAPELANAIFIDRVIKFALLTFLMVVMVESPRYLRYFIYAFLFAVFYITVESVRGLITGGLLWENQGILRLHGAVPIYEHPNSLGGVAMGTLPFVVFLIAHMRRWWQKLWFLAIASTSLICVIYSGSRTAYVGLLGFVVWWWLQSRRKWRFLGLAVVLGAAVILVIPQQYIGRFESIGGQEKEGHSKETRIVILKDAWKIFREHPLGVGIASFPAVRMREFGRFQDTHNLYLEVGTNLGVQGLAVFVLLVVSFMVAYQRTGKSFRRQQRQLLGAAVRAGPDRGLVRLIREHHRDLGFMAATGQAAGGFIFIRLVLGLFGMDLYEVYWWFGAGIAIILSGMETRTRRITAALVAAAKQDTETLE